MNFRNKFSQLTGAVNDELAKYLPKTEAHEETVTEAMRYSLMAGGKRLRPVLMLASAEMLGGDTGKVMPLACAMEMIHTSSLIHDDLPEMDDDDYRRGMLTNHMVFGQGMAVLAGDGLLNLAYETLLETVCSEDEYFRGMCRASALIASCAGFKGMMGGQSIDLDSEGKLIEMDVAEKMHRMKTGALIKASAVTPAYVFDAGAAAVSALEIYSDKLGLAFQISDDILDVVGNSDKLGKKTGSDENKDKFTYVKALGLDGARRSLDELCAQAAGSLSVFGERAEFLAAMAEFVKTRES